MLNEYFNNIQSEYYMYYLSNLNKEYIPWKQNSKTITYKRKDTAIMKSNWVTNNRDKQFSNARKSLTVWYWQNRSYIRQTKYSPGCQN